MATVGELLIFKRNTPAGSWDSATNVHIYGLLRSTVFDDALLTRFWWEGHSPRSKKMMFDSNAAEYVIDSSWKELIWEKQAKGYEPIVALDLDERNLSAVKELATVAAIGSRWARRAELNMLFEAVDSFGVNQNELWKCEPVTTDKVGPFDEGTHGVVYVPEKSLEFMLQRQDTPQELLWKSETSAIYRIPWETLPELSDRAPSRIGVGDDRDDSEDILTTAAYLYAPRVPGPYRWFRPALETARNHCQ